jgi:hypothetical protein
MAKVSTISLEEQLILRIDQELKKQLDNVITTMQEMTKKFEIKQVKERSPFKNVLIVATEQTSSLEVIKNYIRYQAGRKESSKIWKLEVVTNDKKQIFAAAVVEQISNLSINLQAIFDSIYTSLEQEIELLDNDSVKREHLELIKQYLQANEQHFRQSIYLNLVQLYLGYLGREHTALVGGNES